MTSPSFGILNGILNSKIEQIGAHRLGMKLDTGVFSILGANGVNLSTLNQGFVCIPSKAFPGLLKTYALTANQSFEDSNGSSDIIGNLFGTTSGDVWTGVDIPFYLYACIDNAEASPVFGISRIPNLTSSPAAGNIGTPASATAGVSYGMFLFNSVTIANYDLNPVVCVGSFRMRKIAADDWTIQTLSNSDGFGNYQQNILFSYPTGVNGNASGSYFLANGGTAPAFDTNFYTYKISRDGMCWVTALLFNAATGTSGVGAVDLIAQTPIEASAVFGQSLFSGYGGYQNSPGNPFNSVGPALAGGNIHFRLNNGTTTLLKNADFPNTAGYSIEFGVNYPVRTA